jgi:hypothetical protein
MNSKHVFFIYLILSITALTLAITPLVKSSPTVLLNGDTDKPKYVRDETGTVYFWIYNGDPDPIVVRNVTIYYPWGENITIANIDIVLPEDGNYSNSDIFVIPNDESAAGGQIELLAVYSYGGSFYQLIDTTPLHVVEQLTAAYGSSPSVDGFISPGEWDDASTVSFNHTVVYIKQNGENLYAAFNVSDNTANLSRDGVAIAIDVLNDGGASPQDDDIILYIIRNGTLLEARDAISPSSSLVEGWNGSASSTSDYWQAEFNITYAKVQITPGESKVLGLALLSFDFTMIYPGFWPPMNPSDSGPSNWGNLISEENWIPELSSFCILPLFIIATLLAALVCKKKKQH